MALKFRVELVWQAEPDGEAAGLATRLATSDTPSIYLTADGRIVLQGRRVSEQERTALDLPRDAELISVDRKLIKAIKDML